MSNPSQLFLLADHIKLSLLERQRATSLQLDPTPAQNSNISSSLESLRNGIETLAAKSSDVDSVEQLRSQYNDLSRQFRGETSSTTAETLTSPNDPQLTEDFEHARTRTSADQSGTKDSKTSTQSTTSASTRFKPGATTTTTTTSSTSKNVRFRDNPSDESLDVEDEANRAALFQERYRDEDRARAQPPNPTEGLSNQQIHEYHQQVIQEQDEQLDRLGESIGRQRYLSMQIGDELEGQIALLDEVESGVDRHQSRLDGAKRRLTKVGEKAKANWGMTTIVVLIVVLVLLIVLLK